MDSRLITTERIDTFLKNNTAICETLATDGDSPLARGYLRMICAFLSCENAQEIKIVTKEYPYIMFVNKLGFSPVYGLGGK
jgi:sulfur transfer protein SufE